MNYGTILINRCLFSPSEEKKVSCRGYSHLDRNKEIKDFQILQFFFILRVIQTNREEMKTNHSYGHMKNRTCSLFLLLDSQCFVKLQIKSPPRNLG